MVTVGHVGLDVFTVLSNYARRFEMTQDISVRRENAFDSADPCKRNCGGSVHAAKTR